MKLEERIKKVVEENFHKYYPRLARSNVKKVHVKKVSNLLKLSQAMRFECKVVIDSYGGISAKELFVKKHDLSEIEFHRLKKLWKYYGNAENYTIPRALDFVNEENLIILEKVKGKYFLAYLLKNLLPFVRDFREDETRQRMRQVAKWLALFQQKTYEGEKKKLESDVPIIEECLRGMPWWKESQKTWALDVIKDSLAYSPRIHKVACHGCLAPRNIVLTENGITVLDFKPKPMTEGAIYLEKNSQMDLFREHCLFDVHNFMYSVISLHRFPGISGALCRKLSTLFLSEYKRLTQFKISNEAFAITKVMFLIKYLHDLFRSEEPKDLVQRLVPATDEKWRSEVIDDLWGSIKMTTD